MKRLGHSPTADYRCCHDTNGQWKPVKLREGAWQALEGREEYTAKRDQWNNVRFDEVTTQGPRLEVRLQDQFFGGVLEWRVNE